MSEIRIGVIGVGFGQQVHVPAFRADGRATVQAVCAHSPEKARDVARRLGIPKVYAGWRELVEAADIDAVSIATPPGAQVAIALHALRCHKPVLCEKPLAPSLTEAQSLAVAARTAGVAHMIDFEFLEIPVWERARELLEQGAVGTVRHLDVRWHTETYANKAGLVTWKTTAAEGGGTLNNFVSHVFYYLEQLAGPVARLSANLFRTPGDQRAGDTLASLILEMKSGAIATVVVDTAAPFGSGHHVEIYGDQGTLVLRNTSSDYVRGFELLHGRRESKALVAVPSADTAASTHSDGRIAPVAKVARRFLDWVETGRPSRPSFEDGLRVQALLEAARQAHAAGGGVTLAAHGQGEANTSGSVPSPLVGEG